MGKKHTFNMIGGVIIAIWLVMIGILVKKQSFHDIGQYSEIIDNKVDDITGDRDWREIYLKEKKIGYSVNQTRKIESGYAFQEETLFKLNLLGRPGIIRTITRSIVDQDFTLKSFKFSMSSGAVSFQVSGKVDGEWIIVKTGSGDEERTQKIKLTEPPIMGTGVSRSFRGKNLKIGQVYRFPLFDPSTMAQSVTLVKVVAKRPIEIKRIQYSAYQLEAEMWGRKMTFWLDEEGVVLKEEGLLGMSIIRSNAANAPRDIDSSGGEAFYEIAAIEIKKKIKDPRRLRKLKLKVIGLDGNQLDNVLLNEGRQRFKNGVLYITKERTSSGYSYLIPYPGNSENLSSYLKPEFNIESDNKKIINKASEIAGEQKEASIVAKKMVSWVYKTIEKKPVVSVPTALGVLNTKIGDCNEHAVLLAALLRACGIPSRVCVGLVLMRGKFYYHAWNECYLGSWVTLDATLNQIPADASHIKLAQGDLAEQAKIIALMGQLGLEVIDYEYDQTS
jgi:hypothetical protein